MSTTAVRVEALEKRYGAAKAVDGVSFGVAEGEIFAILGPNGAGKTTTIECIEGVRKADAGRIEVFGMDPMRDSRRMIRAMGVQLQSQGLPAAMTVNEALEFFARYRRVAPDAAVAERLGLGGLGRKQYGTLSTGQQRRLALALCLQHGPRLVVLDEPTAGLDVETRDALHAVIAEAKAKGATVILASHDMAEVEKLADRVLVVASGRVAAEGTPREITAAGDSATRVTVSTERGLAYREKPALDGAELIGAEGGYLRYATHRPGVVLGSLLAWLAEKDDAILDLRVERPTLEERFLEIVGGQAK